MSERQYLNAEGNPVTLDCLLKNEPEWAANQIRHRDKLEDKLELNEAALDTLSRKLMEAQKERDQLKAEIKAIKDDHDIDIRENDKLREQLVQLEAIRTSVPHKCPKCDMTRTEYTYKAVVRSVYDADTIRVDIDLGFGVWRMNETVRVHGIDTPELHTGEGKAALGFVAGLLPKGLIVIIETIKDKKEKYGRYLAKVNCPQGDLSALLIAAGHAKSYLGGKR